MQPAAEGGAFNFTPDSNVGGASHLNYLCAPAVRRRQESKLKIIYGPRHNVQVSRAARKTAVNIYYGVVFVAQIQLAAEKVALSQRSSSLVI